MLRRVLLGLLAGYFAIVSTGSAISAPTDMDGVRSLRSLALEQHMRGESDTAMSTYDNALKMATDLFGKNSTYVAEILYEQAIVALACKRYSKAEDCLQDALQINPNSMCARLKLAEYLKLKGRTQEARQQASKVLAKHKDSVEARQIMALTYQEEGNVAKATQECFYLDEAMHGKSHSDSENVAFTQPPPAVAAPAINIPILSQPAPAAVSKPIPVAKPIKKLEPPHKIKPPRHVEKPKPVAKPAPKPAPKPKQVQTAVFTNNETTARLKSKAILLTPIKKAKNTSAASESVVKEKPAEKPPVEAAKPEPEKPKKAAPKIAVEEPIAENADGSEEQAEEPVKKAPPKKVAKPVPVMQPFKIEPVKKPRPGLVPPPPPVVPIFPGMMAPQMAPPPPMQVIKPKPKAVEKHVETPKEHAGSDEDSDFLIEWAGKKKK